MKVAGWWVVVAAVGLLASCRTDCTQPVPAVLFDGGLGDPCFGDQNSAL